MIEAGRNYRPAFFTKMQKGAVLIVHKNKQAFSHTRAFWLFVLPALLLFTIFFIVPLLLSIYFSLTNYDGWKTMDFIGFRNYIKLFQDIEFYNALKRTGIFTLVNLPFKVGIPLLIASLATSRYLKAQTLVRTLVYIPVLLSALVVGVTISWIFGEEYGLVNYLITLCGGTPLQWSMNPVLATFVISFASNWATAGFYMIIFIGGINNISKELYEAANVDGANTLQLFFRITLPLLSPTIFIVLLLATVNLLKEYTIIQGITTGGPGTSTTYIIQYIFNQGFTQWRYGYASAIGIVVGIIFVIIAAIEFKISNGGGEV